MSEKNPVEKTFQSYSHDHLDDTTLEFTRTEHRSELVLTFRSEDPDMGKEEMIFGSDRSEPMADLIADLKNDLTSYLDAQNTPSISSKRGLALMRFKARKITWVNTPGQRCMLLKPSLNTRNRNCRACPFKAP